MNYPLYYIIKTAMAQQQLAEILSAVRAHKTYIEQIRDTKNEKSRKIELVLKPELKNWVLSTPPPIKITLVCQGQSV